MDRVYSKLAAGPLSCLPLLISQQPSQDLTTRAFGDDVQKLHTPFQPFVSRFVIFYMLLDGCYSSSIVLCC